jgi:thioester reductase-like protein
VLSQLIRLPTVSKIYCLVRANSPEEAEQRVKTALSSKNISLPNFDRIHCFPSDLSREDLGLHSATVEKLRDSLTCIIHCAWAVNFNLGVKSFENQHIRGAFNLLNLCLKTRTAAPARFFFCSSISAAAGTPLPAVISESYITDLTHAQNMGYARSKLVTENIVAAAARETGMTARVLRVGQIVGDTVTGTWNTTEAIPLMIRSANTLGVLPALEEVRIPAAFSSTDTNPK